MAAMIGFGTKQEAMHAYDMAFDDGKGPQRRKTITQMDVPKFKEWLKNGDTKTAVGKQAIEAKPVSMGKLANELFPGWQQPGMNTGA